MPLVYRDRNKHSGHRGRGPEKKGEGSDGPDVEPLTGKRIRENRASRKEKDSAAAGFVTGLRISDFRLS